MLVWFQMTTTYLGSKWGFITGLIGYWAFCLLTAWLMADLDWSYFRDAWSTVNKNRYAKWVFLAAFVPVVPTFFGLFLPIIAKLTFATAALVIFTSVVNGPIEEFYWRGLYLLEFRGNNRIGFFLSTLLFGAWHFAVWFAKGVYYSGGVIPLVGGAYLLGVLWAWVTRSTGNFRAAAFAHIVVNLFALSGLFVDNGF
ncbi:MAG: CPBP family intramembrane glutamic endopeptidase [Anaerolineales bacterium]